MFLHNWAPPQKHLFQSEITSMFINIEKAHSKIMLIIRTTRYAMLDQLFKVRKQKEAQEKKCVYILQSYLKLP